MLEYFTIKKVKKHQEEKKAAKQKQDEKNKGEQPETAEDGSAAAAGEGAQIAGNKPEAEKETVPSPSPRIISQPPDDRDDEIAHEGTPVLDHDDEKFLEHLTSADPGLFADVGGDGDEAPPPLPPRVKTPVIDIDSDADSVLSNKPGEKDTETTSKSKGKGKEKEKEKDKKSKRFSFAAFPRNLSLRRKSPSSSTSTAQSNEQDPSHLSVPSTSSPAKEGQDLTRILDDLDLAASTSNRAVSLSAESAAMARRFTQVLKDLINGVPTAYGDLVSLLDDRDGLLARNYEKLPSGLKKLVAQLPEKLTSTLAPELLAAAAEAQGLEASASAGAASVGVNAAEAGAGAGLKGAAKKLFLSPASLHDLVTKPGALVGLLKGIVNALKTRFPAFVGTNLLWSLAVFLLLSMLWYCHKRGREVRLEREAAEASAAAAAEEIEEKGPRVEELPDDPMLDGVPEPEPTAATATETETETAVQTQSESEEEKAVGAETSASAGAADQKK
ncbi:hypothetical protein F4777DRAFT_559873 [Nemania sp. FL0916]|nr:hypothetical protein F4777DRAFT_559873 [Nemania sp. FL0916]